MNKTKKIITLSLLLITFATTIFLSLTTNAKAAECSGSGPCGESIETPGHGAVELCGDCFKCGVEDGVCPAWYSTGDTSTENLKVNLRVGTNDRPNTNDDFTIMHQTGQDACEDYGGDFNSAEVKTNLDDAWSSDSTIDETTRMNSRNNYVRATCRNVVERPSCTECVDVDCNAELVGRAYSKSSKDPIKDVTVTLQPQSNNTYFHDSKFSKTATTKTDGTYNLTDAYSGNVVVTCAAAGYDPIYKEVTLNPGKNIIDCQMGKAECASDCTMPSSQYGERVCASECDGENGCEFSATGISSEDLINACDGRQLGFFSEINTTITNGLLTVTGANCCTDYPVYKKYPLFNVEDGNDVSNLLTRRYNKILEDGTPVVLNIIVYNK